MSVHDVTTARHAGRAPSPPEVAMQCPHCVDTPLTMTERQGIEIDYCPRCRGVWLDRGELDKIIERSAQAAFDDIEADRRARAGRGVDDRARGDRYEPDRYEPDRYAPDRYFDEDDDWNRSPKSRKKRKSLLSELLDFD